MSLALVKAAKTISTQRLQDADVDICVVVAHEFLAVQLDETRERIEVVIEQLLAQFGGQVRLGVVQKRGNVILKRAFSAALVIQKKRLLIAQHDVARLKITIKKIIAAGVEQKIREAAEIIFQSLFAKRNTSQAKKIIFEVVQVPGNRRAIETRYGITNAVVQIAAGFHLEARQHFNYLAIGVNSRASNADAGAVPGKKFEK